MNGYDTCAGCLVDGDVIRSEDSPQNLFCPYCTEYAQKNGIDLLFFFFGVVSDALTCELVENRENS